MEKKKNAGFLVGFSPLASIYLLKTGLRNTTLGDN